MKSIEFISTLNKRVFFFSSMISFLLAIGCKKESNTPPPEKKGFFLVDGYWGRWGNGYYVGECSSEQNVNTGKYNISITTTTTADEITFFNVPFDASGMYTVFDRNLSIVGQSTPPDTLYSIMGLDNSLGKYTIPTNGVATYFSHEDGVLIKTSKNSFTFSLRMYWAPTVGHSMTVSGSATY